MRNQQLKIEIVDGKLVVSIGLDILKFALEHAPDCPNIEISNMDNFAKDFLTSLASEDEYGNTSLHRAFDNAAIDAIESGSNWVNILDV